MLINRKRLTEEEKPPWEEGLETTRNKEDLTGRDNYHVQHSNLAVENSHKVTSWKTAAIMLISFNQIS